MHNPMDRDQKVIKNDEEKYKQIIEYSFETTIIHSNHKVLYINEAGVELLSAKKKEDLIGANVVDVFTEDYRDFIIERIRQGEEERRVGELMETTIYRVDGTVVEVDLFCHPVMYGKTKAMQSIIRDITPRKEAERQLINVMSPIVPISRDVAVLPLVGHVNEDRAIRLLVNLPPKVQSQELSRLIVDVSGLYDIDEVVLDFLYKVHSILNLLGVDSIYTGIRPELAHKLVNRYGESELTSLNTMKDVEQALRYISNSKENKNDVFFN
ncbi:PAS domain S-box protein [Oceanobacillus sp. CF4.6]|uniref:PAS domain S-box protein n=1 Tax=Oceanobacillus sp. CF4.6 TaxID=3373080 RepID=UPI003EE44463